MQARFNRDRGFSAIESVLTSGLMLSVCLSFASDRDQFSTETDNATVNAKS